MIACTLINIYSFLQKIYTFNREESSMSNDEYQIFAARYEKFDDDITLEYLRELDEIDALRRIVEEMMEPEPVVQIFTTTDPADSRIHVYPSMQA